MEFLAEKGLSQRGKHLILIYRSTVDPNYCYKFQWQKINQDYLSYSCLGCKNAKDRGNSVVVKNIRVSLDESSFLSDPEELEHGCTEFGFTFNYLAADVQQEFRLVSSI
jgi:hypothetical protein